MRAFYDLVVDRFGVYIYNTEDIIYMLIQGLYCGINKTKTTWVGTTSFMSSQSFNQLVTIKYNDAVNLKLKVAWIIVKTSSSNSRRLVSLIPQY